MTEEDVRRIVREELARSKPKPALPCGRGKSEPKCIGSAATGPGGCTCPGVPVEFYR